MSEMASQITGVTKASDFDVFFDLRLNNGWANNRDAGDLRRHRADYDVTVMIVRKVERFILFLWVMPVVQVLNGDISSMHIFCIPRLCTIIAGDNQHELIHFSDVIMSTMASQMSGVATVCSGVTGLYERNSPVTDEFPHKGPVTRKMFPFDDVVMIFFFISNWK